MKAMVALEVGVLRLLAARAREAGLDPAVDAVPGLRRDVLFASTAGRGGGRLERRRLAGRPPARDAPRGRRAQRGGRHADRGRRAAVLPDHGRGEGLRDLPHPRARPVEPRLDAARRQRAGARRPRRDAHRGPERAPADPGRAAAARRGRRRPAARPGRAHGRDRRATTRAGRRPRCVPPATPRTPSCSTRCCATRSAPTIMHAGIKYNVIPGEAEVQVDCRTLPGTTPRATCARSSWRASAT